MKQLLSIPFLIAIAAVVWGRPAAPVRRLTDGYDLVVAARQRPGALLPAALPPREEITRLRSASPLGKPKIAYSFNPDDDLGAIRRAGFTHVLVSYLQGRPDEEQRQKLDECRKHGLK